MLRHAKLRRRSWTTLLAALVVVVACAPRQPIDLLVVAGTVVDPSREGPLRVDVAVDDGRIVAVGEDLSRRFVASTTLDASERFVIPGLADLHSHFGNGILGPGEDDTTQVLARHLYYGNTTILNLGSAQAWPERIDELRAALDAGDIEGPRLLAVGSLITRVGSHPTTTIYSPALQERIAAIVADAPPSGPIDLTPLRATTLVRTPEDVGEEVRRVGAWGADAIKITVESGPPEFGVHPRMTPAMIAAAVEAARPFGIPVLCHISMLPELEDCIAQGAQGAVHGITPEAPLPDDLESRMTAAGFALIPTAAMFDGWARLASAPEWLDDPFLAETMGERERAWLGSAEMIAAMAWDDALPVERLGAHIARLDAVGGLVAAGTDTGNPYRFAGHALHEEIAFYARHGLTPRRALATATVNAARLLGAENEWGSIRAGLAADLVILERNPYEAIENTRAIVEVVRAGRVIDRATLPVR